MVKPTKARARHYDEIRNPKGDNSNKQRHSSKRKLAKARAVLAAQRSTLSDDIDRHHSAAADIPLPVAGTSKDHSPPQSRGYHYPYKVRRPDRHAKLKAAKHGCNDTSSNNDAILPGPVERVRGEIAVVLH